MSFENKQQCRFYLRKKRATISEARRKQASQLALDCLEKLSSSAIWVLSYASFGTELDLWRTNEKLAKAGKLVLPQVELDNLRLFQIADLAHLKLNRWGILEPDPQVCQEMDLSLISLAFIPGLGFDHQTGHRLGYGKGYYDRLLKHLSPLAISYGVGFKEQEMVHLPFSEQDIPLSKHYLF